MLKNHSWHTLGTIWISGHWTRISHMQGKCPNCCTVAMALIWFWLRNSPRGQMVWYDSIKTDWWQLRGKGYVNFKWKLCEIDFQVKIIWSRFSVGEICFVYFWGLYLIVFRGCYSFCTLHLPQDPPYMVPGLNLGLLHAKSMLSSFGHFSTWEISYFFACLFYFVLESHTSISQETRSMLGITLSQLHVKQEP